MRSKKLSLGLAVILDMFVIATLMTATRAAAQTEKVLYAFGNNTADGFTLDGSLVSDSAGRLYGTTSSGGVFGVGMVFELRHTISGGWTERVLYNFKFNGRDGYAPEANLIFDAAGNLYGTTASGGVHGDGTVFELTPKAGGGWTETVLFNFNGTNGQFPRSGLIFDAAGNLYGTTSHGGSSYSSGACSVGITLKGCGAVFELRPKAGRWVERVLHSFNFDGTDGYNPTASLVFDTHGNLYGTTQGGGANNWGTVFELSHAGGSWTETLLHSFNNNGTDGADPSGPLTFDASGNLYGTTASGGVGNGFGTVFELTRASGGSWTETLLYSFQNNGADGIIPLSGLIFDASGNLYGTTGDGGALGFGTAFKLTPATGGGWTETLLHSFGSSNDGQYPQASLIFDAAGNLYSTTNAGGGRCSCGTVFEITP
jgi:uncharacterized repeat protein (TIGR03803 family)